MTRDDIERIWWESNQDIFRFAELVAAAEREECAKVCDQLADDIFETGQRSSPHSEAADACAEAIRQRWASLNSADATMAEIERQVRREVRKTDWYVVAGMLACIASAALVIWTAWRVWMVLF